MFHFRVRRPFDPRLIPLLLVLFAVGTSPQVRNGGGWSSTQSGLMDLFNRPLRRDWSGRFRNDEMTDPKREVTAWENTLDPNLESELIGFGYEVPFSPIIRKHGRLASELIQIFMDAADDGALLAAAAHFRPIINPGMFNYALSVALMHREDTRVLPTQVLAELFPDTYIDSKTLFQLRNAFYEAKTGTPIEIWRNYSTASNHEPEHRVAYFREDIGINLHHWNWHLAYPFEGSPAIVNKDRRGELFYHMHHQILARYNAERLSNELGRVKKLGNLREPIAEGYFPKLDSQIASRSWPARPSGMILRDVNRPDNELEFDIQDLERWTNRIYEAIYTGVVITTEGVRIPLADANGIDILGNMIEACADLSPNIDYYGSVHNRGHMAIAFSHDPEYFHLEKHGVMGDSATAMRDPVFYRWHSNIEDFFRRYKNTLPPYTYDQLNFVGIKVTGIQVTSESKAVNLLDTFWSTTDIDASRGLDLENKNVTARVRFTHLNHTPFMYRILVASELNWAKLVTVRIFLAPKINERSRAFSFVDQKELMIEMDRFNFKLQPGENLIERNSTDSALTIPLEMNFYHMGGTVSNAAQFSGCGWPQHMLVPKGTTEGFPMQLFVMISDISADNVTQDEITGTKAAPIFCGLRNRKYPDAHSMGYPFDRPPRRYVETLAQFLTPNMATLDITVKFNDFIYNPPAPAPAAAAPAAVPAPMGPPVAQGVPPRSESTRGQGDPAVRDPPRRPAAAAAPSQVLQPPPAGFSSVPTKSAAVPGGSSSPTKSAAVPRQPPRQTAAPVAQPPPRKTADPVPPQPPRKTAASATRQPPRQNPAAGVRQPPRYPAAAAEAPCCQG